MPGSGLISRASKGVDIPPRKAAHTRPYYRDTKSQQPSGLWKQISGEDCLLLLDRDFDHFIEQFRAA